LTASLTVAGLGPGAWNRVNPTTQQALLNEANSVIVRTLEHPAAAELARRRPVISCDDLYRSAESFEDVYSAITERVMASARRVPTIYAVPGSPVVGEFAVARIKEAARAAGLECLVMPAESFLDALLTAVGYDPLDRGLRVLNGHDLPSPLLIDSPTVIAHLDQPVVMADTLAALQRVLPEETRAMVVVEAGGDEQRLLEETLDRIDPALAGMRTSLFIDAEPGGLVGVVQTMWRLRHECPWDRRQTHETLVKNLVEECFELIEAIAGNADRTQYGAVEDELGDVLLQVLFHAAIARQEGAFDIEDVAENLRQKLVRRHPHVFGTVEADTAEEVKANWDQIKQAEKGGVAAASLLDGVPVGMPALERAAKLQRRAAEVGFDWTEVASVIEKLREEVGELEQALGDPNRIDDEVGDLLFTVVNVSRHLAVDPELALRGTIDRFSKRFRAMEAIGPLDALTAAELDERWEKVKSYE
jgi:tetrapyrrole methylase family protein/MazG family protein